MLKNVPKWRLKVLFCPEPKDIQFIVKEEERKQEALTFKKLALQNLDFLFLKKRLKMSNRLSKSLEINLIDEN